MSMIDDFTINAIKLGQAVGLCDTAEVRKLKETNEKSKLDIEIKNREDAFVKNHGKVLKEVGEMGITAHDAYIYCLLKMDDKSLLDMLKSQKSASSKAEPATHFADVAEPEVPAND